MADQFFDVRKSVIQRNIERIIVLPALAIGFIAVGQSLISDDFVWKFSIEASNTWDGWAFVGIVLICTGIFNLIKTAIFLLRSWGTTGEWHFRLTQDALLWRVPSHAHGPEVGFETPLLNVKVIEFRTISKYEGIDEREYWIHFWDRDPIQLQDYTGISISWLVSKIQEAGVAYRETVIES